MFKFFFKKNTWDIWDNLFHVIFTNLISLALAVGSVFLFLFTLSFEVPSGIKNLMIVAVTFICTSILSIFCFAECDNAAKIADFETPSFANYFRNIGKSVKDGLLFGLLISFFVFVAIVSVPKYYSMYRSAEGSALSFFYLMLAALVFWFLLITALSLQYFAAIRALMGNRFLKCLKKCYILFFDNLGFTLSLALVNLLNIVLTVLTLGMAPGIVGITVTCTNALRLRLYKYDWLEVNPDLSPKERKQVPWADLLEKDRKTLGPRKFRNIFRPWKD